MRIGDIELSELVATKFKEHDRNLSLECLLDLQLEKVPKMYL